MEPTVTDLRRLADTLFKALRGLIAEVDDDREMLRSSACRGVSSPLVTPTNHAGLNMEPKESLPVALHTNLLDGIEDIGWYSDLVGQTD